MSVREPAGLQEAGLELWREVTGRYALRTDERHALEEACRTKDLIVRMEAEIAQSELTVLGSQKQEVAHPLTTEVRQQRALLLRQMSALHLPDEEEDAGAAGRRSEAARALAAKRWKRSG